MYNMQPFIHKIYFPSLFVFFLILFKKTAPIRHAKSNPYAVCADALNLGIRFITYTRIDINACAIIAGSRLYTLLFLHSHTSGTSFSKQPSYTLACESNCSVRSIFYATQMSPLLIKCCTCKKKSVHPSTKLNLR